MRRFAAEPPDVGPKQARIEAIANSADMIAARAIRIAAQSGAGTSEASGAGTSGVGEALGASFVRDAVSRGAAAVAAVTASFAEAPRWRQPVAALGDCGGGGSGGWVVRQPGATP